MKSDADLIEAARQGDERAFEQLLRPYRRGLLTLACRLTGNPEDGQEVAQEAMVKIYRYLGSFQVGRSFKSWTYKIVVNAAHDFLKRQGRSRQAIHLQVNPGEGEGEDLDPARHYLDGEIRETIRACLSQLSPRERSVFCLRDGEGLSIKEAASVLGCSAVSVRAHLCRARQKIKSQLEGLYRLSRSEVRK
jgi:RNA polymerase sigma-70 factor (ECF subfamily)